jgi:hypothetical protein
MLKEECLASCFLNRISMWERFLIGQRNMNLSLVCTMPTGPAAKLEAVVLVLMYICIYVPQHYAGWNSVHLPYQEAISSFWRPIMVCPLTRTLTCLYHHKSFQYRNLCRKTYHNVRLFLIRVRYFRVDLRKDMLMSEFNTTTCRYFVNRRSHKNCTAPRPGRRNLS